MFIIGQPADTALPNVPESAIIVAAACRLIVPNHLWPRERQRQRETDRQTEMETESDGRCERDRVCVCAHYYYNTKNNTLSTTTLLPPSFHTHTYILYNTCIGIIYYYSLVYLLLTWCIIFCASRLWSQSKDGDSAAVLVVRRLQFACIYFFTYFSAHFS